MSEYLKSNVSEVLNLTESSSVRLIAVTKTVPVDIINEAISYGITEIGENKVQELLSKYDNLNKENLKIHLIGRLQTNKVKYIIDKVDLIHSVDSYKLASTINKCALSINKVQDVLIQINISEEESKGGILLNDAEAFIKEVSHLNNIRIRGLMCIPAPELNYGDNAKYFEALKKKLVDINSEKIDNINMDILSMGMSADYETAIKCGSTMVRVGTKIFGKRNYQEV